MNLPPKKSIWDYVKGVGSGLLQGAEGAVGLIPNEVRLGAANLTGNQAAAANARSAIGQDVHQVQGITQPIMRTIPELLGTVTHPSTPYSFTPNNTFEKDLFGSTPVQNVYANVQSNYRQHSNLPKWERVGLAGLDLAGQGVMLAPQVGSVVKGTKALADVTKATKEAAAAQGISSETGAVGKLAKDESNLPPEVPKPNVAQSKVKVTDPIDSAVSRVGANLDKPFDVAPNPNLPPHAVLDDIISKVHAGEQNAALQADELGKAIKQELPNASDRAQVTHALEGAEPASSAVAKVAGTLKALNEKAFLSRQRWDSNIQEVEKYSPRFVTKAPKGEVSGTKIGVLSPGATLTDLLAPIKSRFNLGREVKIFEGANGDIKVGKPGNLGLQDTGHGMFEDAEGNIYRASDGTIKELNAGTDSHGYSFREDVAKNMRDYHRDTMINNIRNYASQALINNADKLHMRRLGEGEEAAEGEAPIVGVSSLRNWVAPDEIANRISKELGVIRGPKGPLPLRIMKEAYRRMTDIATQLIVRNPIIHGQNMAVQALIASGDFDKLGLPGMSNMMRARAAMTGMSREQLLNLTDEMAREGMYLPDYGKNEWGILARMTGGASKYSAKGMASIDLHLRAAAYLAGKEMGIAPGKVVQIVNHYMGDGTKVRGSGVGLFVHYLKTISRSLYGQVTHPIEHAGANVATVAIAATYYSLDKALQNATGNKNAYITPSGELGLAKELWQTGKALPENGWGNFPKTIGTSSIILNHTNPVLKEMIQQVVGKDLFTGQDIQGDRGAHAVKGLVSPASIATQSEGLGGNKSNVELAANQLRVFTPHAPGAPAAPKISVLNTKGAKPESGPDVTGYQQMMASIQAKNKILSAVSGDKRATDAINAYLDRNKDPNTGATVELNPQEALGVANLLASNPKALALMKQYKDASPSHDPLWDLQPKDIKQVLDYLGTRNTDPERSVKLDLVKLSDGQTLADFVKGRDQWYQDNVGSFSGKTEAAPNTPTYPTIPPDLQAKLDQIGSMTDSKTRAQFISDNPDVREILSQLFDYKNAMGVAQGGQALKKEQFLSPQFQNALNYYDTLPKNTGARSAWIRANQGVWSQIQNALSNEELYNISKEGAKNMYQGEQPSQTLLKDISSLGRYGIVMNPSGMYSINPGGAYAQAGGGGGSNKVSLSKGMSLGRKQAFINNPMLPRKWGKKVRVHVKGNSFSEARRLQRGQGKVRIKESKPKIKTK